MAVRFLHTSDWQLGMTRQYLSEGAQERFSQARFDAIRALGRIAQEEHCRFVLVCGDVFESNQVDRRTVARALEALKDVPVPVFLLPGNHDPLNSVSVYRSSIFSQRKPDHVQVIESTSPIKLGEDVEVVGAPWMSKRPVRNPADDALARLAPAVGFTRIFAAHGVVDQCAPDQDAPGLLVAEMIEHSLKERRVQFVALGDRHSLSQVGGTGCVWYSGTPEATDFSEVKSGYAQLVEIDGDKVSTRAHKVGKWRFVGPEKLALNNAEDVQALRTSLDSAPDKELTIMRLKLTGTLTLSLKDKLQAVLGAAQDTLAALVIQDEELVVVPDDSDFAELGFSGFADSTVKQLRERSKADPNGSSAAQDALMLLMRLSREAR